MEHKHDKNYVSVGFWMLAMLVMAIPCVGWIMIVVWAFVGENESRKNYFRALLAWFAIWVGLWLVLMLVGLWPVIWPAIQQQIEGLLKR